MAETRREGGTGVKDRPTEELRRPRLWSVVLHNDDYTSMEFVVEVLQSVFHLEEARAMQVMLNVHRKGKGIAGIYPHEVAETKAATTMETARRQDYPLQATIEEQE